MSNKEPINIDIYREFNFIVFNFIDEFTQKKLTRFVLETKKEFENFCYKIFVQEKVFKNNVEFKMKNIFIEAISFHSSGKAKFEKTFPKLFGKYNFTITNLSGETSNFILNFTKQKIEVVKQPSHKFLNLLAK